MPDKTRTPKQKRSIEKKEAIKKASLELFSEIGYHNTTTNEIAKRAGVSIGSLYSYYPDKRAIYDELVGDIYSDTLSKVISSDTIPDMPIRDLVKLFISIVLRSHEYLTAFQKEISALSMQYPDLHDLENKYRSNIISLLVGMFKENREGLRIKDLDTAALIIQCSVEAVIHEVTFYPNNYDKEKVINEMTDLICRYCFE